MEDNNIELNEIKDTSPIGSTAQKQDKKGDLWLILIALLLAGLLAVTSYSSLLKRTSKRWLLSERKHILKELMKLCKLIKRIK